MNNQRTPGPWQVMTQNLRHVQQHPSCPEQYQVPIQHGTGNVFAIVYGWTAAECMDNARLIAAAPGLSAVLVDLVERLDVLIENTPEGDDPPVSLGLMEKARAALARAEPSVSDPTSPGRGRAGSM